MHRRTLSAATVALIALFALTGCGPGIGGTPTGSSGGGSSEADDPSAGGELGPVLTDCVVGDWHADLNDLAAQLAAQLSSGGLNVTGSTGSGSQDLSIDGEGFLGFANNMTFVITIDMGDGLVMELTQTHTGTTGADWAWDGGAEASDTTGTMVFTNFENAGYTVTNTVTINGQASTAPFPLPENPTGDVPLSVVCDDGTMTTSPAPSPFTTTWHH